ncbi:alpha-xylosidase [Lachnospiraceae bacterium OttesenSCG-928-D06]|nr:alpha-xylosidase [Lachnospiraceae bacterium OttesenSCG-928-D06]
MKFSNGCWLQKEGCEVFSPQHIYESQITETEVRIVTPTSRIRHMGDTLGQVTLTLCITSPMENVIRVQTTHYLGAQKKAPNFDLNLNTNHKMSTVEDNEKITITSGNLSLVIEKENWSMSYYRGSKLLTKSTGRDLCYAKTDWTGLAYNKSIDHSYMRQQLLLSVDESVYGMGERFTPFVKNGQTIDIWNEDGGTSTEQSYKNIPFYMTNQGYGVFVNHPEKVSFEVASEFASKIGFSVPGETLDYFFIDGPSMKEVLTRYTDLTGKPSLPAPWTFGLWLSTSFTTSYDEKTVLGFIDGMLERDIPLKVFHFDCAWMKPFHWTDFVWDSNVFPNPKEMLQKIHDRGIKVCVWINSYIGQESALFAEGMEKGYFLKRANGDVWQWDLWQPGLAIVDFTNPEATAWYQNQLEALIDMGVDCFKTDFGERIPTDAVYFNGADPVKMHNYYSYLYNKAVYEVLERRTGEAVLFARSATVGGQKFPVHWGGDCWSDYSGMQESIRGGLSLTMSGFGFWSHDIGGFESTSTPDVYKRWSAFGLLSSHSRLHGSTSYRVPWLYDEEAVDVLRFFTKLKASIMPYLYQSAIYTSQTGIPVMRSMVMEFTEDKNCDYLDKQYMLGDNLLVAPIFNDQSLANYYLPEGNWTDFLSGSKKTGGKWYKEDCSYMNIPLYVKENSIIAVGSCDNKPDYNYADGAELRIYELVNEASTVIYNQSAEEELKINASRNSNQITINVTANKPYTIRLINLLAKDITGASMEIVGADTLLTPADDSKVITVTV